MGNKLKIDKLLIFQKKIKKDPLYAKKRYILRKWQKNLNQYPILGFSLRNGKIFVKMRQVINFLSFFKKDPLSPKVQYETL